MLDTSGLPLPHAPCETMALHPTPATHETNDRGRDQAHPPPHTPWLSYGAMGRLQVALAAGGIVGFPTTFPALMGIPDGPRPDVLFVAFEMWPLVLLAHSRASHVVVVAHEPLDVDVLKGQGSVMAQNYKSKPLPHRQCQY